MFNLRRFNTKSGILVELIRELLYADDAVFPTHRQTDIQHMDNFSRACNAFGLNINLKKTKVIVTPAPGEHFIEPNTTVNSKLDLLAH